ncbi:hypothetical protein MNV49_000101 [Pseudohyphozyma bogoriensis]|nr:hypothetical protein MNV49_000101 [Pseudohyphozyma bogoriensis]
MKRYSTSKFAQMVGARYWTDRLRNRADVVAVSPGFIPQTGLNRESGYLNRFFLWYILSWAPFCSTVDQGAAGILRALTMSSDDLASLAAESEGVLYLDNQGKRVDPNPLIYDMDLVEWAPSEEKIKS